MVQPAQIFLGAKSFDFKRATVYCLGYRLSKHKMTRCAINLREAWPQWPSWMRLCFGWVNPRLERPEYFHINRYIIVVRVFSVSLWLWY